MSKIGKATATIIEGVGNIKEALNDGFSKIATTKIATVALLGALVVTGAKDYIYSTPSNAAPATASGFEPGTPGNQKATTTTVASGSSETTTPDATAAEPTANEETKILEEAGKESAELQEAGASKTAADDVVNQEVRVFFGDERGEVVGQHEDGACIVETYNGKRAEEFTKTQLAVGQTPEQAKEALLKGLCSETNGVNVAAVSTYMAQIEAMKNNVEIHANYDKVYTEMTTKYLEAMKNNPRLAQAYLETVQEHFNRAEFGEVVSIAGTTDKSIYLTQDGKIVTVTVSNRSDRVAVKVKFSVVNNEGVLVEQEEEIKDCDQPREAVDAPKPQTPAEPSTPVRTPEEPTPSIQRATASACIELPDGTTAYIQETGEGLTQAQAEADAQSDLEQNGEVVSDEECEEPTPTTTPNTTAPVETTSTTTTAPGESTTTTTTTAPDSSTTTTSTTTTPSTTTTVATTTTAPTTTTPSTTTTAVSTTTTKPDKNPGNATSVPSTTAPPTTPESTAPPETRPTATVLSARMQAATETTIAKAVKAMGFNQVASNINQATHNRYEGKHFKAPETTTQKAREITSGLAAAIVGIAVLGLGAATARLRRKQRPVI